MAATFTKAAGGQIDGIDRQHGGVNFQRAMAAAVVGGTASVIGGGKFANGAVTGAFLRMFNDDYAAYLVSEDVIVDKYQIKTFERMM